MPDQSLVERAKAGDKLAFDQLVLRHQSKLLNVIKKYVQDPSEALDIIQEAFIKAYRSMKDFRGDSAFYSWLYRIAVNTAKNHLLQIKKRSLNSSIIDVAEEISTVRNDLFNSFQSLSGVLRETLILREVEGLTYREIANKLNLPIGTVRSRIARGRIKIISSRACALRYT